VGETIRREVDMNKLFDTEIAWLAGIIEGEGSLQIVTGKYVGRDGNVYKRMIPKIDIGNTDMRLLKEVSRILKKMNCVFCYRLDTCKYKEGKGKKALAIKIYGYGTLEKLLNYMMPYLHSKKDQAKVMLDFIKFRKKFPLHGGLLPLNERGKLTGTSSIWKEHWKEFISFDDIVQPLW